MDYKERLLIEYRELAIKRIKVLDFLRDCETNNIPISKEKKDLLEKQLEFMNGYCEILHKRILIEMEGEK